MKSKRPFAAIVAVPLIAACVAALPATAAAAAAPAAAPMDETARMNYALGYQLGRDLTGTEIRSDALLKGIETGRSGGNPELTDEEMRAALTTLEQRIGATRAQAQAAAAAKAQADGKAYLAENARKEGVQTTATGLQYRVMSPGTGRTPAPADTVTVNYRGTLVDGTEFDSSYKRGEPASFPVNGVIPGWTEALQLMKEGAKFQLAIPPELAYGGQGPLANQVLLFEVELLKAAATPADASK